MKVETVKSLTKKFYDWRIAAKSYIHAVKHPPVRRLLSVDAADAQGKLNGMTIVELIAIVNLTAATEERTFITARGKTIEVWAEKYAPQMPMEIL